MLPGVTERKHAGIHEDAFFAGGTMFVHIHGSGSCDIRLSQKDQHRVLAAGEARPHRWAPVPPTPHFIQLVWLLASFINSCREMGCNTRHRL
jgi:Family of unknown function (DUF5519)